MKDSNKLLYVNALVDLIKNPYSQEAHTQGQEICNYIVTQLQNDKVISTILLEAPNKLGYYIHPETFILALRYLSENNKYSLMKTIEKANNIGLCYFDNTNTVLFGHPDNLKLIISVYEDKFNYYELRGYYEHLKVNKTLRTAEDNLYSALEPYISFYSILRLLFLFIFVIIVMYPYRYYFLYSIKFITEYDKRN